MYNTPRGTLPPLDLHKKMNFAPHVVILGAGASRACCPTGDRYGKVLPVMSDFFEVLGIDEFVEQLPFETSSNNLEDIYSELHKRKMSIELRQLETITEQYFASLELPDEITIYDKLLLSLRKKDVIISFNWDPLLCQSFKRWRPICDQLPKLLFLHGNIDVAVDRTKKRVRFASDLRAEDRAYFDRSNLLYPVAEKDYASDPFIADQWQTAERCLENAYMITVFGYSAPKTDVEARRVFLDAWINNSTQVFAELEFIDVAPIKHVEATWDEFTISHHYSVISSFADSYLCAHPRRSCDAFAFATLQCEPWSNDDMPSFENLGDKQVHDWLQPYLEEEKADMFKGKPLNTL